MIVSELIKELEKHRQTDKVRMQYHYIEPNIDYHDNVKNTRDEYDKLSGDFYVLIEVDPIGTIRKEIK